jgi:hypothetical protein
MKCILPVCGLLLVLAHCSSPYTEIFTDEFETLPRGPLGSDVGAHTEYHFLNEAKPKGKWEVSTFRYNLPPSWYVREVDGERIVIQDKINPDPHWHPILVSGDDDWRNYRVHAVFTPRSLDDELSDHADGVAIVPYREGEDPVIMIAASDEGMIFLDLEGTIIKHHYIGHVQNPAVANFRDDLEGLETISVNFWGNQGLIHFFDSSGEIYHSFEPNHYGSMLFPLNWTGKSEEFFVTNANVDEGGVYDGWGRKVLEFPDDGHPDMAYVCLDLTGDVRDEIVVWNPHEIWIYTQEDNQLEGELYQPRRNPMYNLSNYQATVSR